MPLWVLGFQVADCKTWAEYKTEESHFEMAVSHPGDLFTDQVLSYRPRNSSVPLRTRLLCHLVLVLSQEPYAKGPGKSVTLPPVIGTQTLVVAVGPEVAHDLVHGPFLITV